MDDTRYGELLKLHLPKVIESTEEHERLLTAAESLMDKGDAMDEEERQILALLVTLIEAFESGVLAGEGEDDEEDDDEEEAPAPHVTLQRLMGSRSINVDDVADIFGNPHIAREVLDGKRTITRGQAKALGRFFRVPPKLFREA